jgi:ribonuclease III
LKNEEILISLQRRIGYEFKDSSLLLRAVTHSSALSEKLGEISYERIEYLGDAVLELLVTRLLFTSYPNADEGQMTRIRAAVVSEKPLSDIARQMSLGEYLILSRGMEKSNGRKLSSILSDVVEAIIGALYLDGGIELAGEFIMPYIMPKIEVAAEEGFKRDYKTRLQEHLQSRGSVLIKYKTTGDTGPAHNKLFISTLYVNRKPISKGSGKSKKIAQQHAAKNALAIFKIKD